MLLLGAAALANLSEPVAEETQLFFPLEPESKWTYVVDNPSQQTHYVITDRVRGLQFIEDLNIRCEVVDEDYEIDRGGIRPVLYYSKGGFLNRFSGLEYVGQRIKFPVWTLSVERQFLPLDLAPNRIWSNAILPYGNMPKAPTITQSHRSFSEPREIVVPAGHFRRCIRIETHAHFEGGPYKEPLSLTYQDWYAPHVGLVKTLTTKGGGDGEVIDRVQLLKFEPAAVPKGPAMP